jgi:maltooligosyltrehalose synthase
MVVAVPRLWLALVRDAMQWPLGPAVWHDTAIELPGTIGRWRSVLTGGDVDVDRTGKASRVRAADVFATFPVAVLEPA